MDKESLFGRSGKVGRGVNLELGVVDEIVLEIVRLDYFSFLRQCQLED